MGRDDKGDQVIFYQTFYLCLPTKLLDVGVFRENDAVDLYGFQISLKRKGKSQQYGVCILDGDNQPVLNAEKAAL